MSKTNAAASRITLANNGLTGYSGPVDIISRKPRRWWHRLLRRHPGFAATRVYADVNGAKARAWRKR